MSAPTTLCSPASATEAAALALKDRGFHAGDIEHDAVAAWVQPDLPLKAGQVCAPEPAQTALQLANSETGIVQTLPAGIGVLRYDPGVRETPLGVFVEWRWIWPVHRPISWAGRKVLAA